MCRAEMRRAGAALNECREQRDEERANHAATQQYLVDSEAEVERLEAQNDELREALERIERLCVVPLPGRSGLMDLARIARAALDDAG